MTPSLEGWPTKAKEASSPIKTNLIMQKYSLSMTFLVYKLLEE